LTEQQIKEKRVLIFGKEGDIKLDCESVNFEIKLTNQNSKIQLDTSLLLNDVIFLLKPSEDDVFFKELIGNEIKANFNLSLGYSTQNGFHFSGAGGLDINIPTHQQIGPIDLSEVILGIGVAEQGLALKAGANVGAKLGPLNIKVENMGLKFDVGFPENANGNLGLLDLSPGIKPPKGIALSIDSEGFKGGGFLSLDYDKGEYAGGFELNVKDKFSIRAIGILQTKGIYKANGEETFSLMVILTVSFSPGLQLGYGFALTGVGGMLGLNRTMNTDALRAAVKDGSLSNLMFPLGDDKGIMAQAPAMLQGINSIFPALAGNFVFGSMVKISWGGGVELVSIQLGVIIEVPDPFRLAIIGRLRLTLPTKEAPAVDLNIVFAGGLDTAEKLIWFDAQLFQSHVLSFTITGAMALRISYSNQPDFLLSVGGFHPKYAVPARLKVGVVDRCAIVIYDSDSVTIKAEAYFALTSNTVQFGGKIILKGDFDVASIKGDCGLNVMIQFSPFHFWADVFFHLELEAFDVFRIAVSAEAALEGPDPWKLNGHLTIETPWCLPDIDVDFDVEWGEKKEEILPSVEVYHLLKEAFEHKNSWATEMPSNASLQESIKTIEASELILHPFGMVRVSQKVLPLGEKLSVYGAQNIVSQEQGIYELRNFGIKNSNNSNTAINSIDETDQFAPAQFRKMSDDEKLSAPGFEKMKSGLIAKGFKEEDDFDFEIGAVCPEARRLEYEQSFITCDMIKKYEAAHRSDTPLLLGATVVAAFKDRNVLLQSTLAQSNLFSPLSRAKVTLNDDEFVLMNEDGGVQRCPLFFEEKNNADDYARANDCRVEAVRFVQKETLSQKEIAAYFSYVADGNYFTLRDKGAMIKIDEVGLSDTRRNAVGQIYYMMLKKGNASAYLATPIAYKNDLSLSQKIRKDRATHSIRVPKYMLVGQ
jgi:hypothetical protein